MELIQNPNFNFKTCCSELYCDNTPTHFEYILINGLKIVISLCKEHEIIWEERKHG